MAGEMNPITEVVVPVMDETTESVLLSRWLKQEGDPIQRGDVLCEVETEKASVEIESFTQGVLRKVLIEVGTQIPPRTVIALIGPADAPLPKIDPYYQTSKAALAQAKEASLTAATPTPTPTAERKEVRISPRAKNLAQENGIDWVTLTGSGPDGRIVEDDIKQAIQQQKQSVPTPQNTSTSSSSNANNRIAQAKAERVSQSWRNIPHFYMSITIDMSNAQRQLAERQLAEQRRAEMGAATGQTHLTYTDFIIEGLAQTLVQHPHFNGHWQNNALVMLSELRLGLVVQTERGLIIPAMRDLRVRAIGDLAAERERLVQQAMNGTVTASALSEPTFSLSNVGAGHIDAFTAIISPPQVAILSVGSVQPRAWVDGAGNLSVRTVATFTLGADHRAIDGRQSAAFLETLRQVLES